MSPQVQNAECLPRSAFIKPAPTRRGIFAVNCAHTHALVDVYIYISALMSIIILTDYRAPPMAASETTPMPRPPSQPTGLNLCHWFGSEAVDNLSDGFLGVMEPELVRVHKSLAELV